MLAALACVATMIIKLPSPLGGYINLGDCIVLLCGWILGPVYAFIAAGIGSALADIFSGFAVLSKKTKPFVARLVGAIVAEITMIGGYFVFEGFIYGFAPSLVNIPANAVQGVAGIIIGMALITLFEKQNVLKMLK